MVVEFLKHVFGICGDHWHPNVWTLVASTPIVGPVIFYVKCKCGGWFKHKKDCEHREE